MSFGKWYDEKKQQPQPPPSSGGLGGGMGDSFGLSSLFSSTTDASSSSNNNGGEGGDDIESQSLMGNVNVSISSMRSSLESQLPQKIMGMNYQQRFQIFCICLLLSAIFFSLGFFVGIPLITVRPQKFALSFTCGSITFMSSFAILKGPVEHLKSMLAWDRIHFTVVYLGSMMATLYLTFTVGGAQGYVLVLGASALQLVSLLWYLVTFLPGGAMGMKVLTQALWTMLKPLIVGCAKMQAMCISRCVSWYASRFTSAS
mmetsp:Transcript_33482/g.60312  ORF Transcript_33482/g.60312 Transcript_33482/m.60312 type:complete len:258 (+) Transcript_33482:66-839(+)